MFVLSLTNGTTYQEDFMCEIRELDDSYFSQIEIMFRDVFNSPPWNDGWNDPLQLHEYICDMTRRRGSLVFGFFIDGKLCSAAKRKT